MMKQGQTFGIKDCRWICYLSQVLVTKKVLSMSTGLYQREYLCLAHTELAFIHFPTHFYTLKASHRNYTCAFASKPRAQGHCHEKDSEKCAVGKNRPHGENEEKSFS